MIAKVNVEVELATHRRVFVELWDRDVLQDDLIESQLVEISGLVEFIFSTQKSGELNPELEIRVKDESGFEVYRSKVDNSIDAFKVNSNTGFVENTTVTFEKIIL